MLFFGVSVAYAAVGLGGGTAYTALLVIFGASYQAIPTVSLSLNVIATTVGSFIFLQARHGRASLMGPFVLTSVPAAYVGGSLPVAPDVFYGVLFVTLVLVVLRIFAGHRVALDWELSRRQQVGLSLGIGTVLGLLAGIVGIGGGIYLVPLIIIFDLGTEREAAACGVVFTWINSVSGLAARMQHYAVEAADLLPLAVAVGLGAVLGARLGASWLSPRTMRRVLGGIVIVALVLLLDEVVG